MRKVTAWVTTDGQVHLTWQRAKDHAEHKYGTLLCKLARDAATVGEYPAMVKWIEANHQRFVELSDLERDRHLQDGENE